MRHFAAVSATLLVLGAAPVFGHAAPIPPGPAVVDHRAVTLVQGWWEQEHRRGDARRRYWRLPPEELERYNRLQYRINQLMEQRREIDEHIHRAQEEQKRILGFRR